METKQIDITVGYVRDWITTFMKSHFADEISNSNWMIPIREIKIGGKTRKR